MAISRSVFRLHRFEDVALLTDKQAYILKFAAPPSPLKICREKLTSVLSLNLCTGISVACIPMSTVADPKFTAIFPPKFSMFVGAQFASKDEIYKCVTVVYSRLQRCKTRKE
jgi:hypothetical protein